MINTLSKIKYLAGIFDAEGYVRIRKTKSGKGYSYTYEVRIYMCDYNIVKLFADQYNLQIKTANRGINRKLAYYVTLNGKELRESSFISDLLPFLNEKRLQLQEIKNIIDGFPKQTCYEQYMLGKQSFDHKIIEELSYEYLAGIMDGDGWFSIFNGGKSKKALYNNFNVGLEQRYKPMIEYMANLYSKNVHKTKTKDTINHVQTFSWNCTTPKILNFLENIEPFLIEKKEKCNILINYIKEKEKFRIYGEETLQKWKEL